MKKFPNVGNYVTWFILKSRVAPAPRIGREILNNTVITCDKLDRKRK